MNSIKALFSPDKRAARVEARLQRAISAGDRAKVASSYRQSFSLLLKEDQPHLLANLVLTYGSQTEAIAPLASLLPVASLRQAIGLLESHRLDAAALAICDYGGFGAEAVEILAKRGRADELAAWMTKDKAVDKELLGTAVAAWERYNGDIRTDPTMRHVLTSIARFAPGSLPALPRVREIVGQMEEAAVLYVKAGDLGNAARCYEAAGRYGEAFKLYEQVGETERASQAAEAMGDLQEALRLVVNPERKFRLLLQMERFLEAREFAAGLEDPDRHLGLVEEKASERMEVKVKSHDFIGAMKLADLAGCEAADRERILALGRQHLDRKLALAASEEAIQSIVRDRVTLEEAAGCFVEAGRLAEEVLGDLDLASRLYEKAYLFDKAIGTASGIIRRAELHVKGGNQLKAAELYELAQEYDKAYALYEGAQQYGKAVECYLRTAHLEPEVLIRLYTGAGEFEKAIDVYMQAGGFSDLEKALAVATAHGLASHARVIRERMEALISGSEADLARFFEQAKADIVGAYSPVIGIDFGTSNSVAALFNKRSSKPEIVPNARGLTHEPSFFGADEDGHLIFGEAARLRGLTAPDCAVARVKRSLGERAVFSVRGKQYSCEQIVGAFLQHLRSNAAAYVQSKVEARLGELLESGEVRLPTGTVRAFLEKQAGYVHFDDVVLCVPAYFNDNQKRATRDSAEMAGLHVRRLLHEPTAAALAYGHQKPYSGKLAVIDLGGGTLDISVLEIGEGVHNVVTVGGDTRLGGSDIDALLVERVVQDIKERWGIQLDAATHRAELNRLRNDCENLKISLSSMSQYTIELAHFLGRPHYTFALTRTELERLSQPILDRIQTTIAHTVKGHRAGIDGFILVGSATKMTAVADLARRTMGVKELHGIDPATVVATGAALEGAILSGDLAQTLLLDIVPYSLGIAVSSDTDVERIDRLIDKDTTIPTCKSGVYTTKKDNQPSVHIRIYQGESPQPDKNHFLGNFMLDGIPPAPAHTPQIEVTFDIGADCILTVTAVDKATGNKRSIRVEGSVLLSPQEKQALSDYFTQREKSQSLEKELEALRLEINTLRSSCEERIQSAEQAIDAFLVQFHEKIEAHPELYTARPDQIGAIQAMIIEKERFRHGIPTYRDRLASTVSNLHQVEARHLDFSKPDIAAKLRERMDALSYGRQALVDLIKSVGDNVVEVVSGWTQLLASMQPDWGKMDPLEAANHHLVAGSAGKAREILESLASGDEGLSQEAFWLLLKCQVALGLKEEYRDTHGRFGRLFGLVYPDFSRLDAYLKAVDASVFMIQGQAGQQGVSGTGFCVGPGLVVTNRHVVEGMVLPHIRVIGKEITYGVEGWELDPIHDIALLRVNGVLKPLRMGESLFVEPGESILAIGFPSPSSAVHGENIYISRGVVNSIRRTEVSPERVIFIDAKIGQGMSGGPLVNDLGEVVGVVTLVRYAGRQGEHGMVYMENQPVALPVHLVKKHVVGIH